MARTRYTAGGGPLPLSALPAAALRATLREGYGLPDLRGDLAAGLVVGVVAVPLSMALAIAAGVAPQHGLYTAIVAGAVVALLGGSRTQVTGPTAAFVVILAPIHARFGLSGLLLSGLLAGVMLVLLGLFRLGRLIEYIPHPVTTGFTAGIATVIAVLQLEDFLGLDVPRTGERFLDRVAALLASFGTVTLPEAAVGAFTLALLVVLPRLAPRWPAPLLALPAAAILALVLARAPAAAPVSTIASTFQSRSGQTVVAGIPRQPPKVLVPWRSEGGGAELADLAELLPGAFAIAMLGAIESLLSAVVADGMARTKHDPDAELIALGVGNIVTPFFGGIPATGALARTAANVRSGARSPLAAVCHSAVILAAVLLLAPLIGYLPMAALAALLLVVAWNMAELKHFLRILRVGPTSDALVLVVCYALTVAIDMVTAVSVGVVLASLLFMRRMVEVARVQLIEGEHPALPRPVPAGVLVYDVSGPLFFGAAEKATAALGQVGRGIRALIFRLDDVPAMDATGLVALESALDSLARRGTLAILCGVRPQPRRVLDGAGIAEAEGRLLFRDDISTALDAADAHVRITGPGHATTA
jgi:SulP family sulfate permease